MRRIGLLMSAVENEPRALENITAFAHGLAELGWTVGRNVRIEYRLRADNAERVRRHIAKMVALAQDVILANGTSVVGPLLQATRSARPRILGRWGGGACQHGGRCRRIRRWPAHR